MLINQQQSFRYRKKNQNALSLQEYVEGIEKGDRTILAKAITLIESNHPDHFHEGQKLLQAILPKTGKSLRIGITGVPGAGKSTFIESFGKRLCDQGKKVAVLAIDPSSTISKGSILGDKTRMETLAKHPNAFIRPTPSGGTLGGVHRKTRETILLCEAAGYEIILIETVGVGQSEGIVRTMVDFFIMLAITGAGDELQGMKKGLMELVDCIIVTKADGDNKEKAIQTKNEYNQILRFLKPVTKGWQTKVYTCSAYTGEGIETIINLIHQFEAETKQSGVFFERRKTQTKDWLHSAIIEELQMAFFQNPNVQKHLPAIQDEVMNGKLPVSIAVERLIQMFFKNQ